MAGIFGLLMSGAGVLKDQYFNLVSLLLPGNGTNGAQNNTFLDSSTNNFPITRNGDVTQGTFSPFSQTGWGAYFDGSNDYVSMPDSTAFTMGTGDFTVEAWVYCTAADFASSRYIVAQRNSSADTSISFAMNFIGGGFRKVRLLCFDSGGSSYEAVCATDVLNLNEWTHIAGVRNGTTLRIYVNGVQQGTANISTASLVDSNGSVAIGRLGDANALYWLGYISNVRITKGGCLYPNGTTFTPSTTPLTTTVSAGTVSLLTCQNNRFIDNAATPNTLTANNGVAITPFSPFAPTSSYSAAAVGGSGYFDGSGDYLSIADNAAFDFGSGAFTVEAWFYRTGGGNRTGQTVYSQSAGGASSNSALFFGAGNDGVSLYLSTSGSAWTNNIETGVAPTLNAWSHVVWQRNGNTLEIYLNGALQTVVSGSAAFSGTIFNSSRDVEIGIQQSTQGPLFGNLCNLRVVKGATVYTGNFTPPTKPLAASGADSAGSYPSTTNVNTSFASSATSLLLNFTNAGVVDATAKNVLETVGNAQISTTQSKWGGGSISFDGTSGTYSSGASTTVPLGSGDFVVECWVYLNASKAQGIFDTRATNSSTTGIALYLTSGNVWQMVINNAGFNVGGSITNSVWTHVAVVRTSTTLYVYVAGSLVNSSALSNNLNDTTFLLGTLRDNADATTTWKLNGYVDDLRITKGYNRGYTGSTITVPTAPFPLQ